MFSFILTGIGTLLLLIQNIIIARFFGDNLFGLFSFVTNLFLILSILAKFGIENFSLKNEFSIDQNLNDLNYNDLNASFLLGN